MKPITKKVIEAGLVPKHTLLLMQRWGYLDPESGEQQQTIHTDIKEGFTKFVEELDQLLEYKQEEEIKETRFSITLSNPFRVMFLSEKYGNYSAYGNQIVVFNDEADRLIFPASEEPHTGDIFERLVDNAWFEISSVTPLWSGDQIVAYQVEAEQKR